MESLVKLKTELKVKASAANKSIGFPIYIRKPLTAADKAVPPAVKKTYIYYLGVAAFKTVNQEGWRAFFYKTNIWRKRYFQFK